jgi:hypothetical protein
MFVIAVGNSEAALFHQFLNQQTITAFTKTALLLNKANNKGEKEAKQCRRCDDTK